MFKARYLALALLAAGSLGAPLAAFGQTAPPSAGSGPPSAVAPFSGFRAANQPSRPRRHRRGPLARALKGLALSPEQRTKIRGFMHAYRAARKSGTPETRAQVVAQIKGVLSAPERVRFETHLQRALQRHALRNHPSGGSANRAAGPQSESGAPLGRPAP